MKRKKIVKDLSIVFVIIFLSYTVIVPLRIQAQDVSPTPTVQAAKNRWGRQIDQLESALQKAISQLSQKEASLTQQINASTMDTNKAKAAVKSLDEQINALKLLKIPENPTELSELNSINKQLMTIRLQAWKDVTAASKELWTLNQNSKLLKKVAAQLQQDIAKTIKNLEKQKEMMAKKTDGAKQASFEDLQKQINALQALQIPTNPSSGEALKTIQNNYKSLRELALKDINATKKLLAQANNK